MTAATTERYEMSHRRLGADSGGYGGFSDNPIWGSWVSPGDGNSVMSVGGGSGMGTSNGSGFGESSYGSFVEDKEHKDKGGQQKIFLGYPLYYSKGVTAYADKPENNEENGNGIFDIIMYNINNYLPIWNNCYFASIEFNKGNIGTGFVYFGFGLVDGITFGSLYKEMSAAKVASTYYYQPVKNTSKLLKPLGLGTTGRTVPRNLAEKLAMEEIMSNPKIGNIARKIVMNDTKWPSADGWMKMEYMKTISNGKKIKIHYNAQFKNGNIINVDDFKFTK